MYSREIAARGLIREVTQGLTLLALTGSSVGGFLGMLAVVTKAL